jgi:antitoxin (DNA-binding transcriptional repressor) of toxin-antitoxin stability system
MKLSISEARKKLPQLIRHVRQDPRTTVQITVRDEPVAELRAVGVGPEPGEAPRKLLELRKKFAKKRLKARWTDVSTRVKEHLYGPKGLLR